MTLKESYTLQEIILGLREEYRKRESQLSGLKALCFVDKKRIESFRFEVVQPSFKETSLYCVATKRKNLLEKLETRLGIVFPQEERGKFKLKNGIAYFENQNSLFPIVVSNVNQDDFTNRTFKILKSDFTKNIKANCKKLKSGEKNIELSFDQSSININVSDKTLKINEIEIKYEASTDEIQISSSTCKIDDGGLESLLNLEVPNDVFPEYHCQIIEDNNQKRRNIVTITPPDKNKILNLQIFCDTNKTLLVPVVLKKSSPQRRNCSVRSEPQKQLKYNY